jgi:16S rRNA (cytidine1402-2'-O)-methyltransferase
LISSYTSALSAAAEAASGQHYPLATLYVVATPIGNLADMTLRALHVLKLVDRIACEDTRHTQALLRAYGIDKASTRLIALHQHNEAQASQAVIDCLRQGLRVAYVSDAGTPGISDPGARLVAGVRAQGMRIIPLPGASSVATLLCVAGVADETNAAQGFVFLGFLPSKAGERTDAVQELALIERAVVILEAPHRIEALAQALSVLGKRLITVGRELTKQFEEIATVRCDHFSTWLSEDINRMRGEFALVLHPNAPVHGNDAKHARVLMLLLEQLPLKTAVKLTADITGEPRNTLYDMALSFKKSSPKEAQDRT